MRIRLHPGVALVVPAGLVVLGLLLSGCGRRGAPLPPRSVGPAAVTSLQAAPRGTDILLTWTRPSRNEDGSPLTNLLEFRLFRAVSAPAAGADETPPVFVVLATVRADRPENATVQGTAYAYRDETVSAGLVYRYQVQAVDRRGQAGPPSAEAIVDLTPTPAPPASLQAIGKDGVVELEWKAAPAAGQDATPLARGYNVYRGLQPGTYDIRPINARPLPETTFRDAGVSNDVTYYYVVRSVGTDRPPWRESADSVEVSVVPQDFVAPAPPRGLIAIPDRGAVALTWDANTEPDILGYFVYRREVSEVAPVRLTETPIPGTTFTDRAPRSGVTYVYNVTAVDGSPHRNESAPSAEVEVSLQ
jgi:fibronectin type 3 domain-containing protein